jgi:hypothetical protein
MTYPDLADTTIEYYYDNNGNLTKNLDKGIVAIRNNFLNLPDTIQFQNGNQIINSYLADGRKVKAVYKTYSTGIVVPQDTVYHGNASYDISTDEWDGHYMYRSWVWTQSQDVYGANSGRVCKCRLCRHRMRMILQDIGRIRGFQDLLR